MASPACWSLVAACNSSNLYTLYTAGRQGSAQAKYGTMHDCMRYHGRQLGMMVWALYMYVYVGADGSGYAFTLRHQQTIVECFVLTERLLVLCAPTLSLSKVLWLRLDCLACAWGPT